MAVIAEEGVLRVTASISRTQEVALKELAHRHKMGLARLVRYVIDQLVKQGHEIRLPLDFVRQT